jgi:DNA-binding transcriptional regulator of glucitol operon
MTVLVTLSNGETLTIDDLNTRASEVMKKLRAEAPFVYLDTTNGSMFVNSGNVVTVRDAV